MNLQGKTAVVTGGSRGIGRAICVTLAAQGADVVINYAGNAEAAEQTANLCRVQGVQALIVRGNVACAEEVEALFTQAVAAFDKVDILVNNAGITRDQLAIRLSEEDFDAVLDTNLKGAFLCCRVAARMMVKQRAGRIVNISSVVGLGGNAGQANYAASKAGLIGLTKSLAKELAARGITVNAVAPGFIDTEMTRALPEKVREGILSRIPVGALGQPEDVAAAVAFLVSDASRYVTGEVLRVDGGMAM